MALKRTVLYFNNNKPIKKLKIQQKIDAGGTNKLSYIIRLYCCFNTFEREMSRHHLVKCHHGRWR